MSASQADQVHPQVPFWSDPGLLRSGQAASGVAETMGQAAGVVFGGNGVHLTAGNPE